MKSILLTGGTGFIGTNLINSFKNKFKIYVLKRKSNKKLSIDNHKNIFLINYQNINEIENLIYKKKIDYFINLATHYTNQNDTNNLFKIIESNVLFSTIVLNSINKDYLKKVISIGTMHEHFKNKYYFPHNLYAASKKAFYDMTKFYKLKYSQIKFYNLKFYETFSRDDKRDKIIPKLIHNYKTNKPLTVSSPGLSLNFIHVEDVISAINILLIKKIKSGEYQIKSSNFINIKKLVSTLNKDLSKKIKIKINNKKLIKINYDLKKLPYWKQTIKIENFLKKYFYEKNKNKV